MTAPLVDDEILQELDWDAPCQCQCHEYKGEPQPPARWRIRFVFSDQEMLACDECAERNRDSPLLVVKPL